MKKYFLFIAFVFLAGSVAAQTINYTYNNLGRLSKVPYPDSSAISYTYDASGNRISGRTINKNYHFDLPQDNFKLVVASATCQGIADGSVTITAADSMNYSATITVGTNTKSYPFSTKIN